MINLELRKQVTIACGWTGILALGRAELYGCRDLLSGLIPRYETSCDAIMAEFERRNFNYFLGRSSISDAGIYYLASNDDLMDISYEGNTSAIALCKLYLALDHLDKEDTDG
jgi:hypothetical protein